MRLRLILAIAGSALVGGVSATVADHLGGAPAARVATGDDGHFWAEGDVNGASIRFLVDTGATVVALTAEDAARAGVVLDELNFDVSVRTAAGRAQAASITLARISLGAIEQRDIPALVVREGLTDSLLGMSFLGRLSRFEATPTELTLNH